MVLILPKSCVLRLIVLLMPALFLLSCNNKDNHVEKLKEVLVQKMSKGIDKNLMESLDSIRILRIDSLTEKGRMYAAIEYQKDVIKYSEKSLKSVSELSDAYKENIELSQKMHITDSETIKSYEKNEAEIEMKKQKSIAAKKSLDSLMILYPSADAKKFYGYYVQYNVFYSLDHKPDSMEQVAYIKDGYILEDTTNQLKKVIEIVRDYNSKM